MMGRSVYRGVRSGGAALVLAVVAAVTLAPRPADAQNEAFQTFLNNSCNAASGMLADLCTSPGSNVSSDSESSLNPSQAVSASDAALARAKEKRRRGEKLLEEARDEAAGQVGANASADTASMDFGRWSLLVNARLTLVDRHRSRTDAERGFDGEIYTGQIGGDYRVSDQTVIGALLGYDRTETTFDSIAPTGGLTPPENDGKTVANAGSINLFGSHNFDENWFADGNLGFTYTDYSFGRNAIYQVGATSILAAQGGDTDGYQVSGGIGGGYDYYDGPVTIGPYLRLNVVHTIVDAYTETDVSGAGFAMRIDPDSRTSVTSVLGVRASYAISTGIGVIVPQARIEYEHEFDNDAQSTDTSFVLDAANTVLTVTGDDPDRDYLNLGAGVAMVLPNGWLPFIDYEGLVGYEDLDRHRITLGLRKEL